LRWSLSSCSETERPCELRSSAAVKMPYIYQSISHGCFGPPRKCLG
jgi:hypothetical protein